MIALKVPADIANLLASIPVPDKKEDSSDFHVTMFHLGDEVSLETASEAMMEAYEIVRNRKPFQVSTKKVTSFPGGESGVPVIAKIESPELLSLREELAQAFDSKGVEYSKKFKDYAPHCTLAYAQEKPEDQTIPEISWTVDEIVIFAGDKGERNVLIRLPLSLGLNSTASLKVAARYQRLVGRSRQAL